MPLRIAIADDEPAILGLLSCWLRDLGHVPVPAAGAAELVRICLFEPPDVAISDVNMPDCSGFRTAEAILRDTSVSVVLMSGGWDADGRSRAAELNIICLTKPLVPLDLVRAIEDAIAANAEAAAR